MNLVPKPDRPTVNAMAAADRLAGHLEKEGLKLGPRVERKLKAASKAGILTQQVAKTIIGTEIIHAAGGKTASLMWNFILATVATPKDTAIGFADPRTNYVWARSTELAQQTIRTGTTDAARAQVGEVLTNYAGYQVDDTQDKYSPAGRTSMLKWARHLNAGACKWCQEQKILYDQGERWLRHGNCRCYKVPVRSARR